MLTNAVLAGEKNVTLGVCGSGYYRGSVPYLSKCIKWEARASKKLIISLSFCGLKASDREVR